MSYEELVKLFRLFCKFRDERISQADPVIESNNTRTEKESAACLQVQNIIEHDLLEMIRHSGNKQ